MKRANFLIGVLIAVAVGLALSGCATTYNEMKAVLPPEKQEVMAAVDDFYAAKTLEEFVKVVAKDAVLKSSYIGGSHTAESYWRQYTAKKSADKSSRIRTMRNLNVEISGNTAEVSYIVDVIKRGVSDRDWSGSVSYLFKLRREGGVWKIYYYEQ